MPWPSNESDVVNFHVPYPIWTANLRKGYIGCLKGIRINGISPNIASIFEEQQKDIKQGKFITNFDHSNFFTFSCIA